MHPSFTSILAEDNMSWDSYIDSLIGYSRDAKGVSHIDKACIIGMDGGMMLFRPLRPLDKIFFF